MSLVPDYKNPAAEWEAAQQIHAIYSSLAREFALDVTPSQVLETGGESATDEALDSARQWLSRRFFPRPGDDGNWFQRVCASVCFCWPRRQYCCCRHGAT